jgi:chemotaxis protein histidine kinase CheA
MGDGVNEYEEVLAELRLSFCGHAEEWLERIEELLGRLDGGGDPALLDEVVRRWHRLKGAGGTVGLQSVTDIAGRLEAVLKEDAAAGGPLPASHAEFVRGGIRIVSGIVRMAKEGPLSGEDEERGRRELLELASRLGIAGQGG